jgi:hypothetical protein
MYCCGGVEEPLECYGEEKAGSVEEGDVDAAPTFARAVAPV